MKQLTSEQLKSVCDYYQFDLDQGNLRPSLEHNEFEMLEFFWNDFNLRVHCNHVNSREIEDIKYIYFVDGDGEKYECPSLIFKSIAYYITEWSNA